MYGVCLQNAAERWNMNTEIWVITHKKYNEIPDDLYKTIHVGKAISSELGYTGDDTGDNISSKNRNYCELTGMYWLWKNHQCDIIGTCHYRRFFLEKERLLTKEYIEKTLKSYDIIVPQCNMVKEGSLKEQYYHMHCKEDWDICRQVISEKYPDYVNAFDWMQNSKVINFCNMMIARKSVYDSYCEWLFDVLFEVEKRIDIDGKDDYQKRVMGFLSERLLKVWLIANDYKVKEQPVKLMESDEISRHFYEIDLKRQLFNKVTARLIEEYKKGTVKELPPTEYEQGNSWRVNVWMCWWQGEDNAPDLVKKCINSVRNNIDNEKAVLHIITLENCMKYVSFSSEVITKFNDGKISMTTLSDRLKMELLYRYGGVWIDATYYVTDERINDVIMKEGFYTQKFGKPMWDDDVTGGRWDNNFIKGYKGLLLFGFIIRAIDEYYRYMDKSIEYFMTDYMIEIAYNTFDEVRNEVDMCAVNNPEALFFNANGSKIYDESVWKDIVKDTWLFKLNYRIPYRSVNVVGEPTFYGHIIK